MKKQYLQPIPDNLNPIGRRCFKMYIPDDPQWVRMFWGFMWGLTYWTTYERDSADSGKQIAALWRQIWRESHADFENDTDCDAPPITEFIQEWEEELSLKCNIRWCDGELQVLDCDDWIPVPVCDDGPNPVNPSQPGAQSRPTPGNTKCFSVSLKANDQWILPFSIQDGDTIHIQNLIGNWNDGTSQWFCPDGTPFSFGQCFGVRGHDGGDLDPTAYHMQLVAGFGGIYVPATDGDIVVPGGAGVQDLVFRANDGTQADNSGAVSFQVCVTNGAANPEYQWSHTFDFTVSQAGWTVATIVGVGTCAIYDAGVGFKQDIANSDNLIINSPNMASVGTIKAMELFTEGFFDGTNPYHRISISPPALFDIHGNGLASQLCDLSANTATAPRIQYTYDPNVGSGETWMYHITKIILSGTGYDPFA